MAFDLSTARLVSSAPPGGFDLSTATPVGESYLQRMNRTGAAVDRAAGPGLRGLARTAVGAGEDALAMGSGVLGDVAGAATSIATQNPQRGAAVRNALTYQPRTATGQAGQQYVGALTAPVASVVNAVPSALQKHGHPIIAQAVRAAMDVGTGEEAAIGRGIRAATRAPEVARAVRESQDAGFVLPVSQTQPGLISRLAESAAGKIHTGQALSTKNVEQGDALVRQGLGLAADTPLTRDTMVAVRKQAGADYQAVKNIGNPTITPSATFAQRLDAIAASRKGSIRSTPADDPIVGAANELKAAGSFSTEQALAEIRNLRDEADKAYRAGEKRLGSDFKSLASTVEDAIGEHLQTSGAPAQLLDNFRAARRRVAQSYDIEAALDGAGHVDLAKLGARYKRGGMSGPIATAGQFGERFGRKYGQTPGKTGSVLPTSLLGAAATEYGVGSLVGHGNLGGAAAAGTIAGRIALQKLTGSRIGQRAIGATQKATRAAIAAAARAAAAAALSQPPSQP